MLKKGKFEHNISNLEIDKARNLWYNLMKTSWFLENSSTSRNLFKEFPPWKFYIDVDNTEAYRVIGVKGIKCKCCNDIDYFLAILGVDSYGDLIEDFINSKDLVEVKCYNGMVLNNILNQPGLGLNFLKPLGWINFKYFY